VFRLSYGKFDYYNGGDITGVPPEGSAPWLDVETAVAPVVGPVEVHVLNHHGGRLFSTRLYPGPRDVFATNVMEATKIVIGDALDRLKSQQGHILVRVAPGGDTFRVIILDDAAESYKIVSIHGPYESR
jgi:hypothetical protein